MNVSNLRLYWSINLHRSWTCLLQTKILNSKCFVSRPWPCWLCSRRPRTTTNVIDGRYSRVGKSYIALHRTLKSCIINFSNCLLGEDRTRNADTLIESNKFEFPVSLKGDGMLNYAFSGSWCRSILFYLCERVCCKEICWADHLKIHGDFSCLWIELCNVFPIVKPLLTLVGQAVMYLKVKLSFPCNLFWKWINAIGYFLVEATSCFCLY